MELTAEQSGRLYAAIYADPIAKAAAAAGNDQAACDQVNLPTISVYRRIGVTDALRWAASNQRMQKIQTAAASGGSSVRSIAQCALQIIQSGVGQITVDDELMAMLDALVSGAVLVGSDRAAFMARCEERISVAEQAIGRLATIADVGLVMQIDRPNGKIPRMEAV